MRNFSLLGISALLTLNVSAQTTCEMGFAGDYPCSNIDLMSVLTLSQVGGGDNGNDCWGWTGPTGREYAIYGRSNGTSFIEITDPLNPVYLGNLPTETVSSLWRDIKVYEDHAFIVSEAGMHGMQVFDLTQLETVENPPVEFAQLTHYPMFGNAHNIAINEASGYAYAIGTGTAAGGLHIIDISDPSAPAIAGLFGEDGYTHDAQVVNYNGPDPDYEGREIAFACNENTVTIVDVTDKEDCQFIASTAQDSMVGYIHQGWLTEDHRYFLMDDELDEMNFGINTRTYILDVQDLDNPEVIGYFESELPASDHNLYTKGNLCFQANYFAGLRILNLDNIENGELSEVASFDTNPETDMNGFWGAWSVYPYFPSGNVIISTFSHFFVVRPNEVFSSIGDVAGEASSWKLYPNPANQQVEITSSEVTLNPGAVEVYDLQGRALEVPLSQRTAKKVMVNIESLTAGVYLVRLKNQPGIIRMVVEH